ncbi:MAG: hypothetical protein IKU83_01770 [Lachnospiraceae bacterium]|nr:hypothetical protein [Lachnospiraceae bacterium]
MKNNFFKCGLIGWTMELLFSSIRTFTKTHDRRLIGRTSLLMFPIYGAAAVMKPLAKRLSPKPLLLRGSVYTGLIYAGEYVSGKFLKKRNMCPWDYSDAKYNIDGVVRLDYAPIWFTLGLVFEKCLCPKKRSADVHS